MTTIPTVTATATATATSSSSNNNDTTNSNDKKDAAASLFKIRTITAFITLNESDFDDEHATSSSTTTATTVDDAATTTTTTTKLESKIKQTVLALETVHKQLTTDNSINGNSSFDVQTIRIATNPFPEYLLPTNDNSKRKSNILTVIEKRLQLIDTCLEKYGIQFFSFGPASNVGTLNYCTRILQFSTKFSCSVQLQATDTTLAIASAETILRNSKLQNIGRLGGSITDPDNVDGDGDGDGIGVYVDGTSTVDPDPPDGLANFRFCVANVKPYIPFFPAAKSASASVTDSTDIDAFIVRFAIGLENGTLLKKLLMNDANQTIANILPPITTTIDNDDHDDDDNNNGNNGSSSKKKKSENGSNFAAGFTTAVRPIQTICEQVVSDWNTKDDNNNNNDVTVTADTIDTTITTTIGGRVVKLEYMGLDASFNPSLDEEGSVASAIEVLNELPTNQFGGPGTIAAVAAMTTAIQTKLGCPTVTDTDTTTTNSIKITGYNGLMLPLCEDFRLAQLANEDKLCITDLLKVSSVCGVGIDTVPIPGNTSVEELSALLLDVVGLAERWNKPLSCRVFPVPTKNVGDQSTFDSPFLINCKILSLS